MSRKGENIYKRKDGRWEGRYIKWRGPERPHYGYIYGKTYREAKMLLTKAKADWGGGAAIPPKMQGGTTIAEATAGWLEGKRGVLRESTLVKYQNMLQCYILPALGDCRLDQIDQKRVNDFESWMRNSGGRKGNGLSTKTISDVFSLLRSVLKSAQQNGAAVKYTACTTSFRLHSVRSLRVLCPEEQQVLEEYLLQNISLSNLGILLSLYTGLRVGELCALRWGDISFSEGVLYVHQTMQRLQVKQENGAKTKVQISAPKSDCSERKIPLLAGMLERLAAMHQAPDTFFLTGSRTRPIEPRTMQNRFKAVLKACGIADANFHALRHTFATRCVEMGFDAKSLSEILGHTSVKLTLNRYVHPSMELKKRNMDKLDQHSGISKRLTVK